LILLATNVEMDILGLGAFQSETQYLTFEFQKKRSGNKEATALPPCCRFVATPMFLLVEV
jgi:hypothetical protein